MKPVRIVMQAFGPYLKRTEIDFTEFYNYGLFLITGATGCGKTTILDAISYALYGRASGSVRDVRDMRSVSAPDNVDTSVSYEMELGGKHYKFDRGMKIRNVKKHSGTTERVTDYEESCYIFTDGKWSLICTGSDVRDKATELLGFSHEQFSQVVVLPQGEFRRLLVAPSLEKQKILETLFGTARWQFFTKSLAVRSKSIETELTQCEERSSTLCRSAECENREALESLLARLKDDLTISESTLKNYIKTFDTASAALKDAETLEQRFSELDAAHGRLKQLLSLADENEKKRLRLKIAETALQIEPYLDAFEKAQKALDSADKEADEAKSGFKAAQKEQSDAQKSLDECADGDERLKKLSAKITRLEGVLAASRELCGALKELGDKKQERRKAFELAEKENKHIEKISASLEKTKTCIKENQNNFVSHLPDLTEKKAALAVAADSYKKLETQQKTVSELKNSLNEKRKEYKAVDLSLKNEKQKLENMQKAVESDAAYRFAQELHDGCMCPVCGSKIHPEPAQAISGAPSKAQIEKQKQAVDNLGEQEKKAREDGARVRGGYDAAVKRYDELFTECEKYKSTPEQTNENLAAVIASLDKAQKAAEIVKDAEKEEKSLETELDKAKKNLDDLKSQADKVTVELSSLNGSITQLSALVPEQMRDVGAVETQLESSNKQYDTLAEQIKTARSRFEEAHSALAAAQQRENSSAAAMKDSNEKFTAAKAEYERRIEPSGLPQNVGLRSLLLTDEQRDSIRSETESFERNLNLLKDKTAELEKQLKELQRPDIKTLKEHETKAREDMERTLSQKGALEAKIKNLISIDDKLAQTLKREEKLRGDFALYDHIFRLANGENPLKTPIHQFVLGLMLDDIIVSANTHLSQLSSQRYALVRSSMPSRGGGSKGLDLSVEDAWSGGERAVSTLSGGEMFLASLSLAFGLSDVVQSYAGGIRLDSLFIDEGFGSLDTETLNTAMGALERLRLSGMLIGVISHVGELRERIPAHIDVLRLADGTSAIEEITP